jgi:hypothetical protein
LGPGPAGHARDFQQSGSFSAQSVELLLNSPDGVCGKSQREAAAPLGPRPSPAAARGGGRLAAPSQVTDNTSGRALAGLEPRGQDLYQFRYVVLQRGKVAGNIVQAVGIIRTAAPATASLIHRQLLTLRARHLASVN